MTIDTMDSLNAELGIKAARIHNLEHQLADATTAHRRELDARDGELAALRAQLGIGPTHDAAPGATHAAVKKAAGDAHNEMKKRLAGAWAA